MLLVIARPQPDGTFKILQPLRESKENPHWMIAAEACGERFLDLLTDEQKFTTNEKKRIDS